MVSWKEAGQIGLLNATRVARASGLSPTLPVPVFDLLAAYELFVVRSDSLHRLAGMYMPGDDPGVLLNGLLPLARQRFTAAHELGHHVLGHGQSLDPDGEPLSTWGETAVPGAERCADAFAAFLLMPRNLIRHQIEMLGITDPSTPEGVYRIAVAVGASYVATARHLHRYGYHSWAHSTALAKVRPAKIKQQLAGPDLPTNARADVHLLVYSANNQSCVVASDDRLLVEFHTWDGPGWEVASGPAWANVIDDYIYADQLGDAEIQRVVVEIDGSGPGNPAADLEFSGTGTAGTTRPFRIRLHRDLNRFGVISGGGTADTARSARQ